MSNGINFPRIHVATSVVNRILNAAADIEQRKRTQKAVAMQPAPVVPNPSLQGMELDQALQQPTPPVDGGPDLTGAVIGKGLGLQ